LSDAILSLRDAVVGTAALSDGYRKEAIERAERITQLMAEAGRQRRRIAELTREVEAAKAREAERKRAVARATRAETSLNTLRRRRSVRIALTFSRVVRRIKGASSRGA